MIEGEKSELREGSLIHTTIFGEALKLGRGREMRFMMRLWCGECTCSGMVVLTFPPLDISSNGQMDLTLSF